MLVRIALILSAIAVALQSTAHAQVDTTEIDRITYKAIDHLLTNTKFKYKLKRYGDTPSGRLHSIEYCTVTCSPDEKVLIRSMHNPDGSFDFVNADWINRDQGVHLYKAEKGYKVKNQYIPWEKDMMSNDYYRIHTWTGLKDFIFYYSAIKWTCNWCDFARGKPRIESIVSIDKCLLDGTSAYKVDLKSDGRGQLDDLHTYFYINATTGMIMRIERKKMIKLDVNARNVSVVDIDQICEITYTTLQGNELPFPKSEKSWYVWPNGKKEPQLDIEFTEFARYTPAPGELDFERLFGIKPPEVSPRPRNPARSQAYYYLIAAVVLCLSSLALVKVYKIARKRQPAA